ncbi:alginate O-acetyltransferase AlgX-related protein [Asticcacaulis taihuensis]|uniref:alginate O-acetyltransferase AlgX-related protein n=1 Tax=Asticcacaulis taihuensis TaxID=260084 RepID=UPI0026F26958|nr:hypothetical protein [Asticcacaulis taihuensis]
MINWKTSLNAAFRQGVIDCRLESPEQTADCTELVFKGWVLHEKTVTGVILRSEDEIIARMSPMLPRHDVVKARAKNQKEQIQFLSSGFRLTTPYREGSFRLSLSFGEAEIPFMDIEPVRPQVQVLHGHHQYLFLDGDSNDSVGQFTGLVKLSESTLAGWRQNFQRMKAWEKQHRLTSAFIVAPAKEEVLPDFYPYPRGKTTALDQFTHAMSGESFILPRSQLRRLQNFTYSRTDTHWTDAGATVAARAVAEYWKLGENVLNALPQKYQFKPFIGDLGGKLNPQQSEYVPVFTTDLLSARSFDNNVINGGNIQVYERSDAPIEATCVVFGDSFGVNFAAALSAAFRRLVYLYRPATFDEMLIEIEKPLYMVMQINQRFLIGQPDFRKTIFETAAEKVLALPKDRADQLIAGWMAALEGKNANIAQALLKAHHRLSAE